MKTPLIISGIVLVVCCISISIIGFFFFGFANSNINTSSTSSNTSKTTLSPDQCKTAAAKYDKKVLSISGSNIKGTIGIIANTKDCRLEAYYNILLTANLTPNSFEGLPYNYNYVGILHNTQEIDRKFGYGVGTLYAVNKNKTTLPSDPFTTSSYAQSLYGYDGGLSATDTMYSSFTKFLELSDNGYTSILQKTIIEIIDLKPYMTKTPNEKIGGFSYNSDMQAAEMSGNIVKTFNFTVSESK